MKQKYRGGAVACGGYITEAGKDLVRKDIYLLDGDTLKICFPGDMGARPTEFKTTAGSDLRMGILKRAKQ
jgi:hypothetical protein